VHDKESVMNLFEDKLEIKVANVEMTLSMSSVTGLTDLAEDEIIPKPIPMQVCISNKIFELMFYIFPSFIASLSLPLLSPFFSSFIYLYFFLFAQNTFPVFIARAYIILFQIHLENVSLRLNEDRPPNNITSPGPIPIDLNISKLRVARDLSGVFHIEPIGK